MDARTRFGSSLTIGARFGAVATALILASACTSSASQSPQGSLAPEPPTPSVAAASSAPPAVVEPSVAPATPEPAGSDTPGPAASVDPGSSVTSSSSAWSTPIVVAGLADCGSLEAAIDRSGGFHLAADCPEANQNGYEVRTASSADGRTWTGTTLTPPAGRYEMNSQLWSDGGTVYLGYTRVAPTDGGCGDDGLADVGVYLRTLSTTNGAWSSPIKVGRTGDHLQSFQVIGSTVHATVTNEKIPGTWYETATLGSSAATLHPIPGAQGPVSVAVGSDGKPRIAYENPNGIAYGTLGTSGFSTSTIPGSVNGWDPIVALGPGDVPDVLWNRSYHGLGCAGPGPQPGDGTYFATKTGGSWHPTKLSVLVGAASAVIDPKTGDLHALVSSDVLEYFGLAAGADWTHHVIVDHGADGGVLRQDPATGDLFVAWIQTQSDGSTGVEATIRS